MFLDDIKNKTNVDFFFWNIVTHSLVDEDNDSQMRAVSITRAMVMEAVRISETSVCFNETTRRYITQYCRLLTHSREYLKSHMLGRDYDVYFLIMLQSV
jgi:hypothetical protein